MMRAETIFPMDTELNTLGNSRVRKEQVWLTADQYEVLQIVCRALDQSISKWLTETILSMIECELDSTVRSVLQEKLTGQRKKRPQEL